MIGSKQKRLVRLLDIRRLKEASRRQEYGLAMRAEEDARQEVAARRAVLASAQDQTRATLMSGAVQPAELRRLHEEVRFRERLADRSEATRRRESEARERAERAYRDARRDSRSLEKLRERHEEREALSRKRAEQVLNDEAALRRFLDASADAPDAHVDRRL